MRRDGTSEEEIMNEEAIGEIPEVPEAPKGPRKTLIAILLVVIVGVASVSVFIWWYTQDGGEPSPEFNTYSNYGFSIEYPEDMTITEEGVIDATANDNSGMVYGESFGPYEGFGVAWAKHETPQTREDLETALEEFIVSPPLAERKGSLVETTKSGHEMICQRYSCTENGQKYYGFVGFWYCNIDKKLYCLLTAQSTEQDILQIFEQYVDSFICH